MIQHLSDERKITLEPFNPKLTVKKEKPSETLVERFRELAVRYSVPIGYVLIVVRSTKLNWTYAERVLSMPLGYKIWKNIFFCQHI
jgi:hypothetical protein